MAQFPPVDGCKCPKCVSEAKKLEKTAKNNEKRPKMTKNDENSTPPRVEVLDEAAKLITGDRNKSYGEPTDNFRDIAAVWNVQLGHKLSQPIEPGDVAAMMVGMKLVRMKAQPKRDNWTDIAGYAGCGYEVDVQNGRLES
jgi:thiol-disulfide isomerase/thioredoxin